MARILLIEDHDYLRPLLRMSLETGGHEAAEARDGDEGLRLYLERPADVVVCDLFMPVKDGLETIRELRVVGDVKIIAISGDGPPASSAMLRVALGLGAVKALSKPVNGETLLAAIREVLGEALESPVCRPGTGESVADGPGGKDRPRGAAASGAHARPGGNEPSPGTECGASRKPGLAEGPAALPF